MIAGQPQAIGAVPNGVVQIFALACGEAPSSQHRMRWKVRGAEQLASVNSGGRYIRLSRQVTKRWYSREGGNSRRGCGGRTSMTGSQAEPGDSCGSRREALHLALVAMLDHQVGAGRYCTRG